jgi:hypothetical protein
VPHRADGFADGGDVVDDTGAGVDLDGEHSLESAALVGAQPRFDLLSPHRVAPVASDDIDLGAESPRGVAPVHGKLAAL